MRTTKAVYKYPFPILDKFALPLWPGDEILSIQVQDGIPCMWVLVDVPIRKRCGEKYRRTFRVLDTGEEFESIDEKLEYLDTIQLVDEELVFHIFESKGG